MSLSISRSRRCNAGSRMSSLIDSDDMRNEFYDNIYGGLNDEEEDNSYKSESSESDNVDSDFSIDEYDEPVSDDQNEEQINNKKIKSKFDYNRKKKPSNETIIIKNETKNKTIVEEFVVPVVVDIPNIEPIISSRILRSTERKTEKSVEEEMKNGNKNKKEMEMKSKKKTLSKELSQQEMLEEAVITEQINLKSYKEHQKLLFEKSKKSKFTKHSIKGPFIRYHSVSMPIIEEVDDNNQDLSVDDNNNPSVKNAKKYSRTFISFTDENCESLLNLLKSSSTEVPKGSVCPVTQLPARYIDPVSQVPYASSEAFTAIRNEYLKQLELHGNTNQPEVAQWIQWRQENQQKWIQWQQKYCSYDKLVQNETDTQSNQSQSFMSKVNSIPKVVQSSRKRRKFKNSQIRVMPYFNINLIQINE